MVSGSRRATIALHVTLCKQSPSTPFSRLISSDDSSAKRESFRSDEERRLGSFQVSFCSNLGRSSRSVNGKPTASAPCSRLNYRKRQNRLFASPDG